MTSVAPARVSSPSRLPGATVYRCEVAAPSDDGALRHLLREVPMDGSIRLVFPREPSFFAARALEGGRNATAVLRRERDGVVVAMGSRSVKEVHLDGRPALLGYLGQLRLAPGRRVGRRLLAEGYELLGGLRQDDELPWDLTAIVADNVPARRLLERGIPGMPRYTPILELVTLVLRTGVGRTTSGSLRVVDATSEGLLDAMAERLEHRGRARRLAPRWSRARLAELASGGLGSWAPVLAVQGDEVVGCAAVWDQRCLRQCVVGGYAPWLAWGRPVANLALRATGRPTLPPPGRPLSLGYLSHLAAYDATTLTVLVAAARARAAAMGLDLLALGLPAGRSEAGLLRRRFGGRVYRSVLYAVHAPDLRPDVSTFGGDHVDVEVATL